MLKNCALYCTFLICQTFTCIQSFEILKNGAVKSKIVGIPDAELESKLREEQNAPNPLAEQDDDVIIRKTTLDRNAQTEKSYLWEKGVVPYVLDRSLSNRALDLIHKAIEDFHTYTCIRWKQRSSKDNDYVKFTDNFGCYSAVGRSGGQQEVSIAAQCYPKGVVMHEMMHAIGFFHEHNRPDRDRYVSVYWNNIQDGKKQNFCINDNSECVYNRQFMPEGDTLHVMYDYGSLMHYDSLSFSKDSMRATLEPRIPRVWIGQRLGFSDYDLVKIAKLYNCDPNAKPTPKPTPQPTAAPTPSTQAQLPNPTVPPATKPPDPKPVTAQPVPVTKPWWIKCEDLNDRCPTWASQGVCEEYPGFALNLCRLSCHNCAGKKCHDTMTRDYAAYYCQQAQTNFNLCGGEVHRNLCPLTCGMCTFQYGWADP